MLSDPGQSSEFRNSKHWDSPLLDFRMMVPGSNSGSGPRNRSNSLSGNERNRLLLGRDGGFTDRSLVSGIDCREDARSFAMLDFDRDGWLDIALASTNAPRLRLFRNRIGDLGGEGSVVEVVLRGACDQAEPSTGCSNRDGIGAVVTAVTDRRKSVFRNSIGEGLAAQNSRRIRITLAKGETLEKISVRWPSTQITEVVPESGKNLVVIRELPPD